MFKDFDTSPFKKMKPPGNNSFDTMQEIKALSKIPLDKKFVKKYDNIESAFKQTAKENNIADYDKKIAATLINDSAPVIIKLKEHFNRPRPKVSAVKMNINMKDIEMASMKTASYPSGHSVQGVLIGKALGDIPKLNLLLIKLQKTYLIVEELLMLIISLTAIWAKNQVTQCINILKIEHEKESTSKNE